MRHLKKQSKAASQKVFLDHLADGASIKSAAKGAGIGRATIYRWEKTDQKFAAKFEEAASIGVGELEDEAFRRAHDGVKKPVFHSGKKIGEVTEYSDTLLIFLLKGRRPEVYNRDRLELSGPDGGPIPTSVTVNMVAGDVPKFASKKGEVEDV